MTDPTRVFPEARTEGAAPPIPPNVPPRAPAAPLVPPSRSPYPRRGGVGLGVILIALGVAMFARPVLPDVSWSQLWPLIIVVIGVGQMVTPGWDDERGVMRLFDGLGTVLIGLVLLGNTLGYVEWSVWFVLLTLWPVLLIALGISIVGRGVGQRWISAVGPMVIWVALTLAVASSLTAKAPITVPQSVIIHPTQIPFIVINGK